MVKAISEIYTINILSNALKLSYVTSYQDLIKSEKPEIIGQSYWDALISKIQKMLFCELHLEVIDFSNPRGVLERREITLLSLEQQEKLRAIAERLVEATKTENSLRVKVRLLNKLTSKQQIGETKPDEVSEEIWKQLKDLEDEFVLQRKDTEKKLYEINKLSSTLHPLKSKLEKQMEIINEVLSDPSAITRIEDYSNPFSEGNFKNLVKISTLMANAS